jgi:hypothetical protein
MTRGLSSRNLACQEISISSAKKSLFSALAGDSDQAARLAVLKQAKAEHAKLQ